MPVAKMVQGIVTQGVAQTVARRSWAPEAGGSIPSALTRIRRGSSNGRAAAL